MAMVTEAHHDASVLLPGRRQQHALLVHNPMMHAGGRRQLFSVAEDDSVALAQDGLLGLHPSAVADRSAPPRHGSAGGAAAKVRGSKLSRYLYIRRSFSLLLFVFSAFFFSSRR
jgi:hypothetical protein